MQVSVCGKSNVQKPHSDPLKIRMRFEAATSGPGARLPAGSSERPATLQTERNSSCAGRVHPFLAPSQQS